MSSNDPHARQFGVEIECGLPGGVEQGSELFECSWQDWDDESPNYDRWYCDEDGSGVELKTPILRGEAGFEKLRWAMDRLKEHNGFVTSADGLHIHHDAPEFVGNPGLCVQLVDSWRNNQTAIHELVHPRRRANGACPSWSNGYYEGLLKWYRGEHTHLYATRNDLNIASLSGYGSIEFRLHEGTLDADVAIAWIMFGQRFLHEVIQNAAPLEESQTDELLMSRIQLSDEAKAILAAKKNSNYITGGMQHRHRGGDYY